MANVGTLAVNLVARTETFSKNMKGAGKDVNGLSERIKTLIPSAKKLALGVAAAGTAAAAAGVAFAVAATKQFVGFGDQLDKMSARTGVSVESLSELKFAAEQAGTDVETLEKGLFGLSRAVFDAGRGSAEAVDAFKKLGIAYSDISKQSPEEQFKVVAAALADVANEGERGALAQKLLGRAGRQLLPMVSTLEAIRNEARELGLVMSTEDAKAAAGLSDAMNRLRSTFRGVSLEVGSVLAPSLIVILDSVTALVTELRTLGQQFPHTLGQMAELGKQVERVFKGLPLLFIRARIELQKLLLIRLKFDRAVNFGSDAPYNVAIADLEKRITQGAFDLAAVAAPRRGGIPTAAGSAGVGAGAAQIRESLKVEKDQLEKQSSMDAHLSAIEANTAGLVVKEVVIP